MLEARPDGPPIPGQLDVFECISIAETGSDGRPAADQCPAGMRPVPSPSLAREDAPQDDANNVARRSSEPAVLAAAEAASSEPTGFDDPEDYRALFWQALRMAHRITKNKRQAYCRRVVKGDLVTVEMRPRDRSGDRASFGGLFHCGRNGCPVCGPKIAAERAADIALAISAWYGQGGRVAFSTWTMPHGRGDRLTDLLDGLSRAYAAARSTKTPRKLLARHSAGEIVKVETTVGPENGWHPHRHGLTFLNPGTTDEQAHELDRARFGAFSGSLERQGFGQASTKGHDFRILSLDQAHEEIARYVAKSAGHELAAAGTKRARGENRSPLELLLDLGRIGLEQDRRLWLEHEAAMHGRRVLRWSPGLRRRLLPDMQELSDQEAADSSDGAGRVIAAISPDTWRRVWRAGHLPTVLLSLAERHVDDRDRVRALADYLAQHGLGRLESVSLPQPDSESDTSSLSARGKV